MQSNTSWFLMASPTQHWYGQFRIVVCNSHYQINVTVLQLNSEYENYVLPAWKVCFSKMYELRQVALILSPVFHRLCFFIWPDGMLSVFQENTNSISTPTEYLTPPRLWTSNSGGQVFVVCLLNVNVLCTSVRRYLAQTFSHQRTQNLFFLDCNTIDNCWLSTPFA